MYRTNDFHGIDVIKKAESTGARILDDIIYETEKAKSSQPDLLLEGGSKQSRLIANLRARYCQRGRTAVLKILNAKVLGKVPYAELYCEAMAYPLVAPDDLFNWLLELKSKVELSLAGSGKRKKPSPEKDAWVLVKGLASPRTAANLE